MKIKAIILVLLISFSLLAQNNIFEKEVSTADQLEMSFKLDKYRLDEKIFRDGKKYDVISAPGKSMMEAGKPNLPAFAIWIAVPKGKKPSVSITKNNSKILNNINVAPMQPPKPDLVGAKEPEFQKDLNTYTKDELYPAKMFNLENMKEMRGFHLTILHVYPFQYNPQSKRLYIYENMDIDISFQGGRQAQSQNLITKENSNIVRGLAVNGNDIINSMQFEENKKTRETGSEYLIITHDDFLDTAELLADWKTQIGFKTIVKTVAEIGDSASQIEDFIDNAYEEWDIPPAYLLFLGDAEFVPTRYVNEHPYNEGMTGSDLHYADINTPPDYLADISYARIPVDTAEEADNFIQSVLDYEQNPPEQLSFYNNAIMAAAFQDGSNSGGQDYPPDDYADRRFAKTSEDVRNYLSSENYDPERIYKTYNGCYYNNDEIFPTYWSMEDWANFENDTPGQEIPEEIQKPNYSWNGSSGDVSNAVNNGSFFLLHRDHGSRVGWGEPYFNVNHVDALTNQDLQPIVWTVNCQTGWFDNETDASAAGTSPAAESFTEHWMRNSNGGSVGLIAATRVSYSGFNDRLVWGWTDAVWAGFLNWCNVNQPSHHPIYRMSDVVKYGKLYFMPYFEDSLIRDTALEEFQYFGDPTMRIRNMAPTQLTVSHPASITNQQSELLVTSDFEGAKISLVFDDEIIATDLISDGSATLEFDLIGEIGEIIITATGPNAIPYTGTIEVSTTNSAFVVFNSYSVEEESGNGNNVPESNETLSLDMELINYGNLPAEGLTATLSSNDPYVSVIDQNESWGAIEPSDSVLVEDAFLFTVNSEVPDEHNVVFDLLVMDSENNVWTSNFTMEINAPIIEFEQFVVLDFENGNGNGLLNIGEEADLAFVVKNYGNGYINEALVSISSNNENVNFIEEETEITDFGWQESKYLEFTVNLSNEATEEEKVDLEIEFDSTIFSKTFYVNEYVNRAVDDFESGSLVKYQWQTSDELDGWTVAQNDVYEGNYSLKSGNVENDNSVLSLEIEVLETGQIEFFKKVSSNSSLDELTFYIDGMLQDTWNNSGWTYESFQLEPGTRELKWIFEKNAVQDYEIQNAWLDLVKLPEFMSSRPEIEVSQAEFEFINIPVGSEAFQEFSVENSGDVVLNFSMEVPEHFNLIDLNENTRNRIIHRDLFDFIIEPNEIHQYKLVFNPQETGDFSSQISLQNNAGENIELQISANATEQNYMPAHNLTAELEDSEVELNWMSPTDFPNKLQWDSGNNAGSFGIGSEIAIEVASRFETNDLNPFNGMMLHAISFYPNEENCDYTLKVWTGGQVTEDTAHAGDLVIEQPVDNISVGEWNTINLQQPLQINSSRELWIGYEFDTQAGYPAGYDGSPGISWKGDLVKISNWSSLTETGNYDCNWNLEGHLMADSGRSLSLRTVKRQKVENRVSDRELNGYKIYRDDESIAEINNSEQLSFIDQNPPSGEHFYYVTAIYQYGESIPSNQVIVNVDNSAVEEENDNEFTTNFKNIYPNPFYLSSDKSKGNSSSQIAFSLKNKTDVEVEVYNIKGQLVKSILNKKLDSGRYQLKWDGRNNQSKEVGNGIYFIRMQADDYQKVKKMMILK